MIKKEEIKDFTPPINIQRKISMRKDPILIEKDEVEEVDDLSSVRENLFLSSEQPELIEEDKPKYVKSVWVEIQNEEGDIVYLNWETGETSI